MSSILHSDSSASSPSKDFSILSSDDGSRSYKDYGWKQIDENQVAQFVVVNEPALPNWMGSCHPNGSLYEKPLDLRAAQQEHKKFREILEQCGCKVKTVREILMQGCDSDVVARVQLEDLALTCLQYKLIESTKALSSNGYVDDEEDDQSTTLTAKEEYLLSDAYKKECVEKMDVNQLVEVILTRPTIELMKADKDTELLVVSYKYEPLVNLIFCRDQQVTTAKGVVMGRPRSPIRQREVDVMKFCFEKLSVPIIGQIGGQGTLEGGDFFPCGLDLALIGVGLRTNMEAVDYMLENDLFGTSRVAVVKDYFDQDQQRMHLDTVFNIIGNKVCLMLDIIQGVSSPLRRLVDEYVRQDNGNYELNRHDIEFSEYIRSEGYKIIDVTNEMQERYGCNGLNLGNNTLITVDQMTAKHIARTGYFDGKIIVVDFSNNTNMFGSVHCCSQVISRREYTLDELSSLQAQHSRHQILASHLSSSPAIIQVPNKEIIQLPSSPQLSAESATVVAKATLNSFSLSPSNHHQYHPQIAKSFLMITPDNFNVDWTAAKDNVFMADSHETFQRLTHSTETGKRGVYASMLKEFAELHRILTVDLKVEIYLGTHESFHNTPDALFAADWFSTHPSSESGTKRDGTLVLYSMKTKTRRREKRQDLTSMLNKLYPNVLNFSPCEVGNLSFTRSIENPNSNSKGTRASSILTNSQTVSHCKPLEYSSIVLHRGKKVVYAATPCRRLDLDVLKTWASEMKYSIVQFQVNLGLQHPNSKLLTQLHHTRTILAAFSRFNIVCMEAVISSDQERLRNSLKSHADLTIEVTLAQTAQFAISGLTEVCDEHGNPVIVISETADRTLSADQKSKIESTGTKMFVVSVPFIEKLGGGSISGLLGGIY